MKCLCEVKSQLFVIISFEAPLYCTALDSIDNRVVGCCNKVDGEDVAMRRPSTRVPYIILCRNHKEKLIKHKCCPTCGFFCNEGKIVLCSNSHQYHHGCELVIDKKNSCPHCGSFTFFNLDISVTGNKNNQSPKKKKLKKQKLLKCV